MSLLVFPIYGLSYKARSEKLIETYSTVYIVMKNAIMATFGILLKKITGNFGKLYFRGKEKKNEGNFLWQEKDEHKSGQKVTRKEKKCKNAESFLELLSFYLFFSKSQIESALLVRERSSKLLRKQH